MPSRLVHSSLSMRTQGPHGLIEPGHIRTARRENINLVISRLPTPSRTLQMPRRLVHSSSSMRTRGAHELIKPSHVRNARRENTKNTDLVHIGATHTIAYTTNAKATHR
ncbi:hypothetical protein BT93_L2828 [Corymbia citriodora subsp. variegata]|uniref:Uncharacterized protein n=1 Tax=Corymbia citriodora subsp. variegata TaxID=360336 RepID=A0A8T0CLA7_CORYI|nr:hypothetical protein BT93_L2828 [Corymbia citriodora subsp. variegata]